MLLAFQNCQSAAANCQRSRRRAVPMVEKPLEIRGLRSICTCAWILQTARRAQCFLKLFTIMPILWTIRSLYSPFIKGGWGGWKRLAWKQVVAGDAALSVMKSRPCGSGFQPRSSQQSAFAESYGGHEMPSTQKKLDFKGVLPFAAQKSQWVERFRRGNFNAQRYQRKPSLQARPLNDSSFLGSGRLGFPFAWSRRRRHRLQGGDQRGLHGKLEQLHGGRAEQR